MMPCKIYVILLKRLYFRYNAWNCFIVCVLVVSINISLSVAMGMKELPGGLLPIKNVYHGHAPCSFSPETLLPVTHPNPVPAHLFYSSSSLHLFSLTFQAIWLVDPPCVGPFANSWCGSVSRLSSCRWGCIQMLDAFIKAECVFFC